MGAGGRADIERQQQDEPLLVDNPERFCMFPVKFQDIWEMYKKAEASFWTGESTAQLLTSTWLSQQPCLPCAQSLAAVATACTATCLCQWGCQVPQSAVCCLLLELRLPKLCRGR